MKSMNLWTREEILSLPLRKWDDTRASYDSLMVISTGEEHDSGWATIYIVGCKNYQPVEIAVACADDVHWKLPPPSSNGLGQVQMDCAMESGAMHFHVDEGQFKVGMALSSTKVELIMSNKRKTQ